MKETSIWCVALLFVFASVMVANAQEGPTERPARVKELAKRFAGEVVSVDAAARVLVARDAKDEMVFDLRTARIARAVKLETLRPGDRIAVMYSVKEGRNVARAVGRPTEKPRPGPSEMPKSVDKPVRPPEETGLGE